MTEEDKALVAALRRIRTSYAGMSADRIEALSAENERLQLLCDLNAVPAGIIEDRGRMEERAAIVAWLRGPEPYPDGHDIAADIEAGEHLK